MYISISTSKVGKCLTLGTLVYYEEYGRRDGRVFSLMDNKTNKATNKIFKSIQS